MPARFSGRGTDAGRREGAGDDEMATPRPLVPRPPHARIANEGRQHLTMTLGIMGQRTIETPALPARGWTDPRNERVQPCYSEYRILAKGQAAKSSLDAPNSMVSRGGSQKWCLPLVPDLLLTNQCWPLALPRHMIPSVGFNFNHDPRTSLFYIRVAPATPGVKPYSSITDLSLPS